MKPSRHFSAIALAASVPLALLAADLVSALKRRLRPGNAGLHPQLPGTDVSQSTLDATLRSVRDAIFVIDAAGRITALNEPAQNMTGWTQSAARGRRIEEVCVLVDEQISHPIDDIAHRIRNNAGNIGEPLPPLLLRARNGREIPIEAHGNPIASAQGRSSGIVLVLRDLSAARTAQCLQATLTARAEAACRAAESTSRSRDDLLSVVSHELRGPLNSISGWVQLMQEGRLDADQQTRALEAIARGTHAQTRLLDELLDASRVIRGDLRLERSTVDVAVIVRAALDAIRPAAAAKSVALDSALATGVYAAADPQRLQQIFGNLLENAVRFTPPGGSVEVQLAHDGDEAVVHVSDSGSGIRADCLTRIFEPFQREKGDDFRHPGRGLGLGLALAQHLAQQHGGRIEAQSSGPGLGATFTVRLPLLDPTRPFAAKRDLGATMTHGHKGFPVRA